MSIHLTQRTLAKPVSLTGRGVHSGIPVALTIKPAPPCHGIKFIRTDIANRPTFSAHFNNVVDTSLATVLGNNGCIVSTIEHLMATFSGLSIDNAVVEMNAYEVPIMDGSALEFTRSIQSAGIVTQDEPRCFFVIKKPIHLKDGDKSVVIYPSDRYRITCTIEYDHPLIKRQEMSVDVTELSFEREIAGARTFGFYHEVEYLKRYGFAKGGSLENAVVVGPDGIMNPGGLRFEDEFVRHKVLDCIGDFALLGMPMLGHVVIHKSGHAFNHAFLKKFFSEKGSWETITRYDSQGSQDYHQHQAAMVV